MPERGFEFFPSPENPGDDLEIIAYVFLYCTEAVRLWPEFRRRLEAASEKSREQCNHIQAYAIEIFREVRDTILAAIETGDMALLSELGERYAHAAATMALYADTPSLVAYRRMICPRIDDLPEPVRPTQGDFEKALWERQWSSSGDRTPGEVTYRDALRNRRVRENDGRYNTRQRVDRVATAEVLQDIGPEEKPAPLSEEQIAQFRRELRVLGVRAGLKRDQVDFLVGMALEGKQQKDNPTAWRAIRGRKRKSLMVGVTELLGKVRSAV